MSDEKGVIYKNKKHNALQMFTSWVKCRLGLRCYILQKDAHKSVDNNRLPHAARFKKARKVTHNGFGLGEVAEPEAR